MVKEEEINPNAVNLVIKANDIGTKEALIA